MFVIYFPTRIFVVGHSNVGLNFRHISWVLKVLSHEHVQVIRKLLVEMLVMAES